MGLLSSLVVTSYRLPVVTIGLSCRFRYDLSRTDRRTGIDLAKGDTMSQKQKNVVLLDRNNVYFITVC